MAPADPLGRPVGRTGAPAGARASRSGSCTPSARGDAPESGGLANANSGGAATFHPRDEQHRLVSCGRCGGTFPQAEVRRFETATQGALPVGVSLCLVCAVHGLSERRVLESHETNARVLELVAAALANPTWGETHESRVQRVRMRHAPRLRRLFRVVADVGGAA